MCSVQDKNKTDLFLRFRYSISFLKQNQKQIYINTLHLNIISYLFIIFLRSNKKKRNIIILIYNFLTNKLTTPLNLLYIIFIQHVCVVRTY